MSKYEIMEELENKVVDWGYDRGILTTNAPDTFIRSKQLLKTEEEVAELADAIASNDREGGALYLLTCGRLLLVIVTVTCKCLITSANIQKVALRLRYSCEVLQPLESVKRQ